MADFGTFLKRSEIVNSFFANLYIIKILDRLIRIMCKNYRFMCEIFETIINLKFFYYILCKYWVFEDISIKE